MHSLRVCNNVTTCKDKIPNHVVQHFNDLFNFVSVLKDNYLVEEVIPNLVIKQTNNILTMMPSEEEIYNAFFSLKRDSVAGPKGFGPIFYQTYWKTIKDDVIKASLQFFKDGWINSNYNSNTVVLIQKINEAESIEHYELIALANFKFKIITKVFADKLAQILPHIILKEPMGFVKDKSIKGCICFTFEVANIMHKKTIGGNLILKVDISKVFDTLNWNFLLKVLAKFGFNDTFCLWIKKLFIQLRFLFLSLESFMVSSIVTEVSGNVTRCLRHYFV